MMISVPGFSVGHKLFNQANASDVSNAGIIPSSSLTKRRAFKASKSLFAHAKKS